MSREIKFRVWDKQINAYVPIHAMALDGTNELFYLGQDWDTERGEFIIEQFTGIQDINGKDIYEGDMVSLVYALQPNIPESEGIYEVFYKRCSFYLKQHKHNWISVSFGDPNKNKNLSPDEPPFIIIDELPLEDFRICKVIGNIQENPELIKIP
jgi:uncharacterized phage protein (TIGR01671 family)